jgi:hypothetical protein
MLRKRRLAVIMGGLVGRLEYLYVRSADQTNASGTYVAAM